MYAISYRNTQLMRKSLHLRVYTHSHETWLR